jgi:hypothetical protein
MRKKKVFIKDEILNVTKENNRFMKWLLVGGYTRDKVN